MSAPHQHLLLFPLRFATLSAEIGALVRLSVGALYASCRRAGVSNAPRPPLRVPTSDTSPSMRRGKRVAGRS